MTEVTSYVEGTPSWIDLMPSDPERARSFYRDLFGWGVDVGPEEAGHYAMATVRGLPVAGIGGTTQPDTPVAWTTYFATDDVDAVCERIATAGGSVMMPPMDVMEFGRMAMAADPTGAVFGMWQAGTHSGAQVVNEPVSLVWNELTTPDAEKASRFYGEVLGHTTATVPESDDEGGMLQVGDRPVANVNETTDAPPGWGVYFNVADADATVSRAEELGATVVSPVADTPWGRMATLEDPQGARFSVIAGETG